MSFITGFSIYYLSFFPLWISILFLDIKNIVTNQPNIWTEKITVCLIIFVTLISLIILIKAMNPSNINGSQSLEIIDVKEEKTITAEFLLSYILPLFAFDFTLWDEVIQFLIFFFTFAFLCIRHNYFSVNILLEIFKYRFYLCKLKNEDEEEISKIIICREILSATKGPSIRIRPLNNEYSVKVHDIK